MIICSITGCSKQEVQQYPDFSTVDAHIKYIIEEYSFGKDSEYIKNYVENTYATNEFIIDSLANTFSTVNSIEKIDNEEYKINVDENIELFIKLNMDKNIIKKIIVRMENDK